MGSKKTKQEKGPRRPVKDVLVDMGLCVLSGVLWFCACSDIDIWPLAWFATVPMLWVIHDKRPGKAFWYGMLAGFVANYGGFYWITGTLVRFAGLPTVVGLFGTSLLAFYQGLVWGVSSAVVVTILRRRFLGYTFVLPAAFVSLELLLPMEFPFYVAITQAWVRPVIQIADLTGPLGVSFVLLMFSGALFDLLLAWRRKEAWPLRRAAIAGGLVVFTFAYGFIQISRYEKKIEAAPKLKIGVVQANLGIRLKGRRGFALAQLDLHHHLSLELQKRGADLIVWPESTHPFPMARDREEGTGWDLSRQELSLVTRAGADGFRRRRDPRFPLDPKRLVNVPMLIGVQTNQWGKGVKVGERFLPERIFNSAVLIDSAGNITDLYDKMYLVTFSEQIPFYETLNKLDFLKRQFRKRHMSNFTPGKQPKVLDLGKFKIGPMVCFEDILPQFGRKMAAEKPNVFINITNDAWFGATAEPYQHLALAVFRTIEHRRPMVRAVNTGTSTFIDATGRITVQTPAVDPPKQPPDVHDPTPHVAAAGLKKLRKGVYQSSVWPKPYILIESVAMMPHSTSIYAAVGWLFGWLCLFATLYLLVIHGRGLRRKAFRYRGDGMALPDRKGRLVAPKPEQAKPKANAKPEAEQKPVGRAKGRRVPSRKRRKKK